MSKYHDWKHLFASTESRKESIGRKIGKALAEAEAADSIVPGAGAKARKEAARLARMLAKN